MCSFLVYRCTLVSSILFTLARPSAIFSRGQLNIYGCFKFNWKEGHECQMNVKHSAASNHISECDCSTDFSNLDILVADVSKSNFLIKESLLIKCDKPELNRTVPSFPLELFDDY